MASEAAISPSRVPRDGGVTMKVKLAALVAAAVVATAAFLLSSSSSSSSLPTMLEIRDDDGGGSFELIPIDGGATGPESVAFDDDGGGGPYTGVSDGRVLRWLPGERRWVEHSSSMPEQLLESCRGSVDPGREHECGRPLGLKFHRETRELYVADAYHGLRVVGPGDNVSRRLAAAAGPVQLRQRRRDRLRHRRRLLHRDQHPVPEKGVSEHRHLRRHDRQAAAIRPEEQARGGPAGRAGVPERARHEQGRHAPAPRGDHERQDPPVLAPDGGRGGGGAAALVPGQPQAEPARRRLGRAPRPPREARRVVHLLPVAAPAGARAAAAPRPARLAALSRLGRQVIAVRLSEATGEAVEALSVRGAAVQEAFKSVSEVEERDGRLFIGSVTSPFLGVYRL